MPEFAEAAIKTVLGRVATRWEEGRQRKRREEHQLAAEPLGCRGRNRFLVQPRLRCTNPSDTPNPAPTAPRMDLGVDCIRRIVSDPGATDADGRHLNPARRYRHGQVGAAARHEAARHGTMEGPGFPPAAQRGQASRTSPVR
jgi:hypothetical protein